MVKRVGLAAQLGGLHKKPAVHSAFHCAGYGWFFMLSGSVVKKPACKYTLAGCRVTKHS